MENDEPAFKVESFSREKVVISTNDRRTVRDCLEVLRIEPHAPDHGPNKRYWGPINITPKKRVKFVFSPSPETLKTGGGFFEWEGPAEIIDSCYWPELIRRVGGSPFDVDLMPAIENVQHHGFMLSARYCPTKNRTIVKMLVHVFPRQGEIAQDGIEVVVDRAARHFMAMDFMATGSEKKMAPGNARLWEYLVDSWIREKATPKQREILAGLYHSPHAVRTLGFYSFVFGERWVEELYHGDSMAKLTWERIRNVGN